MQHITAEDTHNTTKHKTTHTHRKIHTQHNPTHHIQHTNNAFTTQHNKTHTQINIHTTKETHCYLL